MTTLAQSKAPPAGPSPVPPPQPAPAPGPRPPDKPGPTGPGRAEYEWCSTQLEEVSPMQKTFTLIPPHTLKPGQVVFFHAAGMREFTPVTVLPRGPRGQFMVEFHGSPLAVSEGKELFEVAS